MQVKPTTGPVVESDATDDGFLRMLATRSLPASEVAVALAASDLPGKRGELALDDAVSYAVQGLKRLGIDAARQAGAEVRRVNVAGCALYVQRVPVTDPRRQELARRESAVWNGRGARSVQWCWDLAYDVTGVTARVTAEWAAMQAATAKAA